MGNLCGKQEDGKQHKTPVTNTQSTAATSAAIAAAPVKKLDPKDYILTKLTGETVIKPPGSIAGQSFDIEYCTDCDILVCDNSAQVQIDDCVNCNIYVGPCESSIFIRNCQQCRLVTASQQLRLRDCTELDLMVYVSAGQPIIESSKEISISAFQFNYFELARQFDAAKLSPFNTEYSNVHDFTPAAGKLHWQYLPYNTQVTDLMPFLANVDGVDYISDPRQFVVPRTYGNRSTRYHNTIVLFVTKPNAIIVYRMLDDLHELIHSEQIRVIRTRETALTAQQHAALSGIKTQAVATVIAVELDLSTDAKQQVSELLARADYNNTVVQVLDASSAANILFAPLSQI